MSHIESSFFWEPRYDKLFLRVVASLSTEATVSHMNGVMYVGLGLKFPEHASQ